jgi:UDP-N-acetylglucosamine/UDP-N-acetylgalactosamine diphosphorylase
MERAERHGQQHIFRFWDELTAEQKEKLIEHSLKIDYALVNKLYNNCVASKKTENYENIEQPDIVRRHPSSEMHDKALKIGEEAIKRNELALFLVAGGQGSRLGYSGPKGMYPATPMRKKPLFEVFAEKILAAQKKYGVKFDWYIMTSEQNNAETEEFFRKSNYFDLDKEQINFFIQGELPSVSREGKILLKSRHEIFFNPDGTGGIYAALVNSGMIEKMKSKDTKYLAFFNVDNPLANLVDPLYLGYHIMFGSELSTKVMPKKHAHEPLGVIVKTNGRHRIIEYMHFSKEDMEKTTEKGELFFRAGNTNILLMNISYIERIHNEGKIDFSTAALKKVPHIDENGNPVIPEKPNAYKFEAFVFDPMPHAEKSFAFEISREEEFAPIKNAEGEDSPAVAYQMQTDLFRKWLLQAGLRPETVEKIKRIEISPLFADSAEELREKISKELEKYEQELSGKEEYYFGE